MNLFVCKDFGIKPYRFFLPLMWLAVILLLAISIVGLNENGWSLEPKYFMSCDAVRGCLNEYYMSSQCMNVDSPYYGTPLCTQEFLVYGESIGVPPSFIVENMYALTFGILFVWLVLNHVIFNKGWKYE